MTEPYCLAMILCDELHKDAATGKNFILGTFSTMAVRSFDEPVRFCVYVAVTDGRGSKTFKLKVVPADDLLADPIFESPDFDVNFPGPLAVADLSFRNVTMRFPSPGLYHCELWCGEECLMSRRVIVGEIQKGDGTNEPRPEP